MKTLLTLAIFVASHLTVNAQTWQDVGGGTNNSSHGMLVWNGQLINLGSYNNPCNRVAAWDGTSWTCLGGGVGIVARAGCVWNGNLVVVGDFWNNFQPCAGCNGVAVWDGTSWTALDQGFNNDVLTCTVYNGDLIIGGDFTEANGVPINRVARWNETTGTFESMGAVTDMDNDVRCMTVFDGELWVGGDFNNVGGNSPSDGVVKWDETTQTWTGGNSGVDLVGGVNETVRVLYVNPNDGNLYMGGEFPELIDGDAGVTDFNMAGVAMYDGSNWYPLGTGLSDASGLVPEAYCRAIHEYNGNLIVGGYFTHADGVPCNKIAKWNGTTFAPMSLGFDGVGVDEYVKSATVWNGIFFAGGAYTQAEGGPMNYIAQWYEASSNPPTASFSASATNICSGECINFTDLSTNAPTSWTWSFPGASTTASSDQHPTNICYSTQGNYTVELIACNSNGCDTVTQNISVNTSTSQTENATVCSGDDYTYPDGTVSTNITANESHDSYLQGSNGCDSIVTTNLTVTAPSSTTEDMDICSGSNYTYPDGTVSNNITVDESHVSALTGSNGCDSLVTTNLTVLMAVTSSENVNVCSGGDYTYPDGTISTNITANESHDSYLMASSGCDSVVTTTITVDPPVTSNESIAVCSGGDFTYPDGTVSTNITTGESHDSYLTTTNGCDSIVTTTLTVNPPITSAENVSVCSGGDYTYPDGIISTNITAGESHDSYLTTVNGCDSIVTTTVTVNPPITNTENVSVCSGSNYTYPDGTVSTNITTAESHDSYLSNANGCDSVVTTNISITTVLTSSENVEVCSGDNYTYPDGTTSTNITSNESHNSTLQSTNGCDSIVTTNVTVLSPSTSSASVAVCSGDSYTYPDGSTVTNIQTAQSHDSYLTGANGCDSIVTTNISVNATPSVTVTPVQTICEGSTATLTATPSVSGGNYTWTPNNETTASIVVAPGIGTTNYSVTYELNGCSTTETTSVTVQQMPSTVVSVANNVLTAQQNGSTYQWMDCTTGQDISGETSQSFAPTYNGSFAVEVDLNGCIDTSACEVISTIGTIELKPANIWIMPNPISDVLIIRSTDKIAGSHYVIFSTDGKRVLEGTINKSQTIDPEHLTPGAYFLHLESGTPLRFIKL